MVVGLLVISEKTRNTSSNVTGVSVCVQFPAILCFQRFVCSVKMSSGCSANIIY